MTDNEELTFDSIQEELEYWKEKAMEYRQSLAEVRAEFDDFQESSRELEAELEAQLEQAEGNNKDLHSRVHRLQDENDSLKSKLDAHQNEMYVNITTLQEERAELMALKETLQKYIRQLEQSNDDLERGKRVIMSSLEDFEMKLNQAFERNAILENELDEKQRMVEMCQRLKDEVRDLHSELSRQNRKSSQTTPQQGTPPTEPVAEEPMVTSSSTPHAQPSTTSIETSPLIRASTTPRGTPLHTTFSGTQNFTPSTRISALNMVGDLLRKVGALESRLASCRTHLSAKDGRHIRTTSPVDTPKVKRMHMQKYNGDVQSPANLTKITV